MCKYEILLWFNSVMFILMYSISYMFCLNIVLCIDLCLINFYIVWISFFYLVILNYSLGIYFYRNNVSFYLVKLFEI